MSNTFTTISSKGQVVIPVEMRQQLGLEAGTRMALSLEHGQVVLQPVTEDFIDQVAGSYKGKASMVEARERDHRIER